MPKSWAGDATTPKGVRFSALIFLLTLPLYAQDVSPKPSPFPEKNRQPEALASAPAKRSSAVQSDRPANGDVPTASVVDNGSTTAAAARNAGRACFFSSKEGADRTASGKGVQPDAFVAAHATYPLGSLVRVTNLANGNVVEVRILDRFSDATRIIGVGEAAARGLGFHRQGTARLRVDPVQERESLARTRRR